MSDYDSDYSRIGTRGRKRKQNRLLNLMIIVVLVLIIIVGYSIFKGGGAHQASGPNTHNSASGQNHGGQKGSKGSAANSKKHKKQSDASGSGNTSGNSSTSSNQSTGSQQSKSGSDQSNASKNGEKTGPHNLVIPQGPWSPVGTQQQSPHHTSYSSHSQDWNEQMQAMYEATGLTSDNSTLWWLERDGGDGKSVGYISPKDNESAFYIVHIQWVDQKGWKPVKVERKYVADPHAWFEKKKSE